MMWTVKRSLVCLPRNVLDKCPQMEPGSISTPRKSQRDRNVLDKCPQMEPGLISTPRKLQKAT